MASGSGSSSEHATARGARTGLASCTRGQALSLGPAVGGEHFKLHVQLVREREHGLATDLSDARAARLKFASLSVKLTNCDM